MKKGTKNETKRTGIIYARQSSGDDDFSASIDAQIENCQKLAQKENIEVIGVYQDLNTSGKTYPATDKAKETAFHDGAFMSWFEQQTGNKMFRQGLGGAFTRFAKVDFVLLDDMTRLYRPVTGSYLENFVNNELNKNNIKIYTVKEGYIDLSKPESVLIQSLKNQINDQQIANCKKKALQALQQRRNSGLMANGGGKAFATVYNKATGDIEFDPNKAEIVKYIFDEIEQYTPYQQIVANVYDRWKSIFQKSFYPSTLYSIAANPVYCGYMHDSEGMLIENRQVKEGIVSFEQWAKVQKITARKKQGKSKPKFRWLPFSGLLYCGNCGAKLVSQCDVTGIYYYCKDGVNYRRDDACRGSRVVMSCQKDNWCGLKETLSPLLVFALFHAMDKKKEQMQNKKDVEALKIKLANMESKKRGLTEMYIKGLLTDEELEKSLSDFKKQMQDLQMKIKEVEIIETEDDETTKHLEMMYRRFNIDGWLENLTEKEYEMMLKETVQRIDVFRDSIKITTVYGAFTLPRYIYKNRRNFPVPELVINGKTMETMTAVIKYKTGKDSILAKFPKMEIVTI